MSGLVNPTKSEDVRRVLIVGFGSAGKRHLRTVLAESPGVAVGALRRAHAAMPPDGCQAVFSDIRNAIEWRPDVAIISGPASTRCASAVELAAAGIDLLLEKPLAHTFEDGLVIDRAVRKHRVCAAVGYVLRHSEWLKSIRNIVETGRIGRCLCARLEVGQFLPDWRSETDYRDTVTARKQLGGGAVLDLSHEIDAALWLFGHPTSVSAHFAKVSDLDIDVEDMAELVLEYGGNGRERASMVSIHLDLVSPVPHRSITIYGESAVLRACGLAGTINIDDRDGATQICETSPLNQDQMFADQWNAFVQTRGSGTPPVSVADGLETLRVIEAARSSDGAVHRTSSASVVREHS